MNAPAANDRPTLQSARRGDWKVWLLGEWSLLLLAVALTVIIWLIVRDTVRKDYRISDVEVRILIEEHKKDRLGAVITGENLVDLLLHCSPREKEEVEEQLRKDGWRVDMLVRESPRGGTRRLNQGIDRYQWKFAYERILKEEEGVDAGDGRSEPLGTVFKIEPRKVRVSLPETPTTPAPAVLDLEHKILARVEFTPKLVDLLLPAAARDEPLVADPIDLRGLLGEPNGKPTQLALTFRGWKGRDSADNPQAYRRQLEIPPVTATITMEQVAEESISNDLLVVLPAKKYDYNLKWRGGVGGVSQTGDLKFEGKLKGPLKVLEQLKEDALQRRGSWIWAVRFKDLSELSRLSELPKDASVTLEAEIVWVPLKGVAGCGVQFLPTARQTSIDIEVRLHPDTHK